MDAKEKVYKLLYQALLEIRLEAYDTKNKKIFQLADLFHDVPLKLKGATEGSVTYEEVLRLIEQRAQGKPSAKWLEHTVNVNL